MDKEYQDKIDKQNKDVLKQNENALKRMSKSKMKRHVQEENEPVLDDIIDSFQSSYGKLVAAKSSMEILKFVKNEF